MTEHTRAKWAERIREWRDSGLSAEDFTAGKDYEASSLRWAVSQLGPGKPTTDGMGDTAAGSDGSAGAGDAPAASSSPTEGTDKVATAGSTDASGTVHFRLRSGFYSASFRSGGYSQSADFLLDQDQIGGLLIRLEQTLPETKPPADATETAPTSTDPTGAASASQG